MQQHDFVQIVKQACECGSLPQALDFLKTVEDSDIAEAAKDLTGQFAIAEAEGKKRIYHVTQQENEQGEMQDYVEHIMNEGDDVIGFVAWFFESEFSVKKKEVYQAAGKTYQQPKRNG
ncbi:hypothetical protein [Vibrio quintilis]|nr:hypothetical protein [Vibrio quintilis]